MSTDVARSRPSSPASHQGDSTVSPTPNVNNIKEKDAQTATVATSNEGGDTDVEKAAPKPAGFNESDLLTGRTLAVVWFAFLLSVLSLLRECGKLCFLLLTEHSRSVLLIALDNTIVCM